MTDEYFVSVDQLLQWIDDNKIKLPEPPPVPPPQPEKFRLVWPVDGPKVVTQYFYRNKANYAGFGLPGHEGIDLRAINGARIIAGAKGTVYRVETVDNNAYGIHVRIQHDTPEGTFKTVYAHFSEAKVQVGQEVSAGELVGLADNTGNSSGAHFHLTLKKVGSLSDFSAKSTSPNEIINPLPYLPDIFPGIGFHVDVDGNFRTEPKVGNNLIRLVKAGSRFIATGEFVDEWWEGYVDNVKGWFWEPGYKLTPIT